MSVTDKALLQCFWDLASEVTSSRVSAVVALIDRLKALEFDKETVAYTYKRLLRGLSSPRDAARQGFASALNLLLEASPMDVLDFLKMLEELTTINAAMRGSEERDVMFGRVFGCVALARAGLLGGSPSGGKKSSKDSSSQTKTVVEKIVKMLSDLHGKKLWVQELTGEALLTVLSYTAPDAQDVVLDSIISHLQPRVVTGVPVKAWSLDQLNENQLVLLVGVFQVARRQGGKLIKILREKVSRGELAEITELTPALFETIHEALQHATNTFPALHRVWDSLLSLLMPVNSERELVRCVRLGSAVGGSDEETAKTGLEVFCAYISQLFGSSKEKRACAMKLTLRMVQLVPPSSLPVVIGDAFLRSVAACRAKPKNLLYEFAGSVLSDLTGFAMSDEATTLALLGVLAELGGAGFDKRMNVKVVTPLLESLSMDAASQYARLLCGLLGAQPTVEVFDADTGVASGESVANIAIVGSLAALAKHCRAPERDVITVSVLTALSRLACFACGRLPDEIDMAEFADSNLCTSGLELGFECIRLLECGDLAANVDGELATEATNVLLALLNDSSLHGGLSSNDDSSNGRQSVLLTSLWETLHKMIASEYVSRFHASKHKNSEMSKEDDEEEEEDDMDDGETLPLEDFATAVSGQLSQVVNFQSSSTPEGKSMSRLTDNCIALQLLNVVYFLSSGGVSQQSILALLAITPQVLTKVATGEEPAYSDAGDDDASEDGGDACEVRMLEACVELLSVSSDGAIRGLRDLIKRLWGGIFALLGDDRLAPAFIDSLLAIVTDPDADIEEEAEAESAVEENEEGGDGSECEAEASDSENEAPPAKKRAIEKTDEKTGEITIASENVMDFLLQDDGKFVDEQLGLDGEDDEMVLEHTEDADDALVNLIKVRKEHRKAGILAAQKRQILLRARVCDILDVLLARLRDGPLLFSLFNPLLVGSRKAMLARQIQEIPEGRTFSARLASAVTTVLCKKKIVLKVTDNEELAEQAASETENLVALSDRLLLAKEQPLRLLGQDALMAITRTVIASDATAAQDIIRNQFNKLLTRFIERRRSEVTSAWLTDILVTRFPDFFLPSVMPVFVAGLASTTNAFRRVEISDAIVATLKKFPALLPATQTVVANNLLPIAETLVNLFSALANDEAAKRVKPLLVLHGAVTDATIKPQVTSVLGADNSSSVLKSLRSALEKFNTTLESMTQPSPALKTTSAQLLTKVEKALAAVESAPTKEVKVVKTPVKAAKSTPAKVKNTETPAKSTPAKTKGKK